MRGGRLACAEGGAGRAVRSEMAADDRALAARLGVDHQQPLEDHRSPDRNLRRARCSVMGAPSSAGGPRRRTVERLAPCLGPTQPGLRARSTTLP
jgi:hypothetical protein